MMKKTLLIIRVPVETVFGLIYMCSLFLLPHIFTRFGASIIFFGFLGMPRHTNGSNLSQTELEQINYTAIAAGLILVSFLVATGLLWFKDVYNIIQKLRHKGC